MTIRTRHAQSLPHSGQSEPLWLQSNVLVAPKVSRQIGVTQDRPPKAPEERFIQGVRGPAYSGCVFTSCLRGAVSGSLHSSPEVQWSPGVSGLARCQRAYGSGREGWL